MNTLNWFEINVTDLEKSAALYGAMLDRTPKREVLFGIPHAIFAGEAPAMGGTLIQDPKRSVGGSGTVVYFHAADGVARCLARAVEAGAKVLQPALEIAPFGEIALISDLDGNVVGLHAPK